MAFLQCPNSECGSHGPFEVTALADAAGHPTHQVLQCPLCNTIIAVLDPAGREMKFPEEYERTILRLEASIVALQSREVKLPEEYGRAILRLETSMRSIQSNMTHLRSQLATLQGQMARR